jgi:hypothetical protein
MKGCNTEWAFNPTGDEAIEIVDFLGEIGRNTWSEIEQLRSGGLASHHSQSVETFEDGPRADFALSTLGKTFGDVMFRFRLSSRKRLWGFRKEGVFYVVWWDTNHRVYTVETA